MDGERREREREKGRDGQFHFALIIKENFDF
jgi:hypothetical protein